MILPQDPNNLPVEQPIEAPASQEVKPPPRGGSYSYNPDTGEYTPVSDA